MDRVAIGVAFWSNAVRRFSFRRLRVQEEKRRREKRRKEKGSKRSSRFLRVVADCRHGIKP
ncbi:hypothetical protein H5410_022587 [Solanum commersonii]|uniref:Uncharacterized protein n=1 Tax=Solanum commersonii TaxID=4109 RepID=A0A9J5ZF82_SOLCO|nr:hypothetical protein H5410_022587 [Solanum commersonii]